MEIVVRVLGPLEARLDDQLVDLGPPQQRTFLALLALRAGRSVDLDVIEEAIWGDLPPPSATKVIQTYVSRLRKLLGPDAIESSRKGYALAAGVAVDAAEFRHLSDERCFNEALALWRGRALVDVPTLAAEGR